MRTWYKYLLTDDPAQAGATVRNANDAYINTVAELDRAAFLDRIRTNDAIAETTSFLRRHLSPNEKVISIGAGNAEYEVHLVLGGQDILITDKFDEALGVVRRLFPEAATAQVDITDEDFEARYADLIGAFDAVFVASLLYWLRDDKARLAMANVVRLLKPGGRVLMTFRSRDTLLTRFIDDVVCRFERPLNAWKQTRATRRKHFVFRNFAGYRRSLDEFRDLTTHGTGLRIVADEYACAHREMARSAIFRTLRLSRPLGRLMPRYAAYLNMFVLALDDTTETA